MVGEILKHPNADSLSVTTVLGNPVVIRTEDYKPGDLAVYVPVDAMVPTARPEFAFLNKGRERHRVRAARLRGIFSMGLLVKPWPQTLFPAKLSSNVQQILDIEKYVPLEERKHLQGEVRKKSMIAQRLARKSPKMPVYGRDPMRRYEHVLPVGTEVSITEKLHGMNARYCFSKGRLWTGSHRTIKGYSRNGFEDAILRFGAYLSKLFGRGGVHWSVDVDQGVFHRMATQYDLKRILSDYPDYVLYGEIYGVGVQKGFTYDATEFTRFRAFDCYVISEDRYLNAREFQNWVMRLGVPIVPELAHTTWTPELKSLADGPTTLGGEHMREGIVVKPAVEMRDTRCGRVALKFVSEAYHLQKGD